MSFIPLKLLLWPCILVLASLIILRRRELLSKCKEIVSGMRSPWGSRIQLNEGFARDVEAGLMSSNFDVISHNRGDQRKGLDDISKIKIQELMERDGLSFDQARLEYMRQNFQSNSIALDGTPLDPKAVTFGSR
ncbi:LAQU0S02e04214g1_1 [Lachancea quebecensis]|uniref:LAQU0S02e04214g1_1 n=1 Tax=Lachancea quebecensis TaxID=1654605 RepID=A0A0P1KP78_9SACH|nr:LAQU0S02e04214g1_1 [Lachancea quebecensis]